MEKSIPLSKLAFQNQNTYPHQHSMRPTTRIPGVVIRPMVETDYAQTAALWHGAQEIRNYIAADSPQAIARFLKLNPDTCFVADASGQIIGTILGGFDGRRGYIYHLVV